MAEAAAAHAPRLLIMSDDPLTGGSLAQPLEQAGFDVVAATSASAALERARATRFSLSVLDFSLPGESSLELASTLALLQQPFMFLTATADEEFVARAVSMGTLAYVVKPVDPPQLMPTVRAAVHRGREIYALLKEKERLSESLTTSREVSVALGLLMAHFGLPRQSAFELLRQHARRTRRAIRELALEVTASLETVYGIRESGA